MDFSTILSRITDGEVVSPSELLHYLCRERREQRADANRRLAQAYWQSGRAESLQYAKVCIQRAWLLSGFAADLLPLYVEIHLKLGDIAEIKEAYKRAG